MSFIDQIMAARGLPVSNRLFGNTGGTQQNISQQFLQRMGGTPPINPNPNLPSIPDGGYGAPIYRDLTASPNLLPTGTARRPVDIGLMGQERQSNVIPEFARVNAQSEASLRDIIDKGLEKVKEVTSKPTKKSPKQWDEELEKSIIAHEGYRGHMYLDTEEVPTVGIGHTVKAGGPDPKHYSRSQTSRRLSMKEAKTVLKQDLKKVKQTTQNILNKFQPKDKQGKVLPNSVKGIKNLDPAAKNIVTEMIFQMGPKVGNWTKMLTALQNKNYKLASKHMLTNFEDTGGKYPHTQISIPIGPTQWANQTKTRAEELARRMRNI